MASSCLAPPVADQTLAQDIAGAVAAVRTECGALAEYLDQVVDHRSRQGLRYELGFLLGVVVAVAACAHAVQDDPRRPVPERLHYIFCLPAGRAEQHRLSRRTSLGGGGQQREISVKRSNPVTEGDS